MTLLEIIGKVKDKSLTKNQLEEYRDDLSNITARLFLELSDLEKMEALFAQIDEQETETGRKRRWKSTESGLRMIEVKNYIRAAKEMLSSLRNRLYEFF